MSFLRKVRVLKLFTEKGLRLRMISILLHKPGAFLSFLGIMRNKGKDSNLTLPISVDIEPTTRCNLKCKFCSVPGWERSKLDNLSLKDFKNIIDQLPNLVIVKLQGMGETLLNKDFFRIVDYAYKRHIMVYTTINGTLLTDENIKKMVKSRLASVTISLDGAKKETYESIRRGSDFNLVINNIRKLVKARKSALPKIKIWMVATKDNYKEIPELIELCKDMGVDELTVQLAIYAFGRDSARKENKEHMVKETKDFESFKKTCISHAKKKDLKFSFYKTTFDKDNICFWPWSSFYITVEGKVMPCCRLGDPDTVNFGSVKEKSIKEIWNSKEYASFRRRIRNNQIPNFCKACYEK